MKTRVILVAFLCISLPVLILSQTPADLNSDTQVLLEFAATVPHLKKLNWNSSLSICKSWVGITCNKNGTRVIGIHLPGAGLYGSIPENSIGKLDALRVLSLRSNDLNGNLPPDILSLPFLQSLYLHQNNFSGNVPASLSPRLAVLDLSFNSFTGEIPSTIGKLTRLSVLNLQFNSFSGAIPNLDLPRLKNLNLSHNMLTGSIPISLEKFPDSSFMGNPHLCGSPLTDCSVSSEPSSSPDSLPYPPTIPNKKIVASSRRRLNPGSIVAIAVGASSILLLVFMLVFFCCLKKRDGTRIVMIKGKASSSNAAKNAKSGDFGSGVQEAEKNKLVFFEGCSYNFNLEDLLRASAEVLGKGSYGTSYKAVLDEGIMVVVKRLREVGVGKKDFEQHIEVLGKVGRHPNIVPLRAYYYSKDEKLLVYEYMSTGSLSSALHGNKNIGKPSLDWNSRLKISLGLARGISHIHTEGGSKFTHGNIKSSNVLLSRELDGCITDFGLCPLMNFLAIKPRGIGYHAPEVLETRKVSQKSDVYGFGVLLLEMLTGKSPITATSTSTSGHDDIIDLPRWVRSVVREEWTAEVFDVELMKYQNIEEEMVQMLQIALSCVAKVAEGRPTMDEVVRMIEDIRQQSDFENRFSSEDNKSNSNVQTP